MSIIGRSEIVVKEATPRLVLRIGTTVSTMGSSERSPDEAAVLRPPPPPPPPPPRTARLRETGESAAREDDEVEVEVNLEEKL